MHQSSAWQRAMSNIPDRDALDALFDGLPKTLSVEEVSEVLNITRQNTYVWLRDGVIPGYKLGTTWRVIRDELKETMRSGTNASQRKAHDKEKEQD